MKLLNDVVDLLSDENGSLNEALLKTKVLLHKIGQQELTDWVNSELNGYGEDKELPAYRIVGAQVLGSISNMAYSYEAHPVPIGHLTPKQRRSLESMELRQALGVLEKFGQSKKGHLEHAIPLEFNHLLGKTLTDGYVISRAWSQVQIPQIMQVLIEVRSRLLDFILGLQSKLGESISEGNVKAVAATIDAPGLFAHSIFGDNVTIVVGSDNKPQIINIKVKGDFNLLAEALKKHGVAGNDITKLEAAIKADANATELTNRKFGPAVKLWLQKMLAKAVDASWQIELGIASGILTSALQHFYGW